MSSEETKRILFIFLRVVALALGLALLVSAVGDFGLLVIQELWQGLSQSGVAVFKIVVGIFLTVASIKPDIVYHVRIKPEMKGPPKS